MKMRDTRGLTLLEVLVAVGCVVVLFCLFLPFGAKARGEDMRAACSKNCMELIKQCHIYSDPAPNLGQFPIFIGSKDFKSENGDGHTQNGRLAMSQLFSKYAKDAKLFSCPGKPTDTSVLKHFKLLTPPTVAEYTNYGYDPGHTPIDATAGILGDLGDRNAKNGNSTNHGAEGAGQVVAIGAGSVEWWASSLRNNKNEDGVVVKDDIYASNLAKLFPEEYETHIVK